MGAVLVDNRKTIGKFRRHVEVAGTLKILDTGTTETFNGCFRWLLVVLGNESVRSFVDCHLDGLQGQLEVLHRVVHLGAQVVDTHVHRLGQLRKLGGVLEDGLGASKLVRLLDQDGTRVGVST